MSACADYAAEQWELADTDGPGPGDMPGCPDHAEAMRAEIRALPRWAWIFLPEANRTGRCCICQMPFPRLAPIYATRTGRRLAWHPACHPVQSRDWLSPRPASDTQILRCSDATCFPDIHRVSRSSGVDALQPAHLLQPDSHSTADNEAGCGLSPYQGGNPRPAIFVSPLPVQIGAAAGRWADVALPTEVPCER